VSRALQLKLDFLIFLFFLAEPFRPRKITTDPHILADVNMECPDDMYPELKICDSELILDTNSEQCHALKCVVGFDLE